MGDTEQRLPDRLARRERNVPIPESDNVDALAATMSPEAVRVGRVEFAGRVGAHPLRQTLASPSWLSIPSRRIRVHRP